MNSLVDMMNWSTQDYSQYETKQIINPSMSVTSSPASIVVNQLHGADTATLSPTTATQKDVQKTAETVPVSKTSSIVSKSSNVMTVKSDMNSKSLSAKTLDPILLQQQQQQLEKQQQIPLYEEEIIDGVLNDLHQIVDVEKTLEKVEVQTTSTVSKSISSSLKAKFQLQQPAVLSSAAMMEHQSIELEIAYSAHLNSYLPTITVTAPKGQKLTSVHIHGYHGSLAKDEIDG